MHKKDRDQILELLERCGARLERSQIKPGEEDVWIYTPQGHVYKWSMKKWVVYKLREMRVCEDDYGGE